jgi:hypothetical protein
LNKFPPKANKKKENDRNNLGHKPKRIWTTKTIIGPGGILVPSPIGPFRIHAPRILIRHCHALPHTFFLHILFLSLSLQPNPRSKKSNQTPSSPSPISSPPPSLLIINSPTTTTNSWFVFSLIFFFFTSYPLNFLVNNFREFRFYFFYFLF